MADTHVHYYRTEYAAGTFWSAAVSNLSRAARQAGVESPIARVLCLTEREDCHAFAEWAERGRVGIDHGGAVETAGAPWCLAVHGLPGDDPVYVIAGRQIATRERLEVAALCTLEPFADGMPFEETVAAVTAAGAVAVVPWAPGKWWGVRGRQVDQLARNQTGKLALGDSATRPRGWRTPAQLRRHRAAGGVVLAGSDPYPLPGEERRVGTYATVWTAPEASRSPADLCRAVFHPDSAGALRWAGHRRDPGSWARAMWRYRKAAARRAAGAELAPDRERRAAR